MNLEQAYNREDFLLFLKSFVPKFSKDIRRVTASGLQVTKNVFYLGECSELNLTIFELTHSSTADARVALAMDGFKIMKSSATYRAIIIYRADKGENWRLSLMTATPGANQKGKVSQVFSNPRRFSFFLGPNAKVNTPHQFLIKKGAVKDFQELQRRFSIEVVNKEFYKQISENFIRLVGGTLGSGKNKKVFKPLLNLPSVPDNSKVSLEFAVRLIGRIIFCWFLREKKSAKDLNLMPNELLSLEAVVENPDYYHQILEPIFFEVLNKEFKSRLDSYSNGHFSLIPYLNGGLFSPQDDDYYKRRSNENTLHNVTLIIPNEWFVDFFKTLEIYNFTIDENTSFDEELSIDPEMLGRIFENLLAEINPETGESARKSTGSYYTPRAIVDYMIDESLLLYLKPQTNIDEKVLRSIISYDLSDDLQNPINQNEKQVIIDALERLKLLDPACGSGAFPIGALQKIVFILQQIDQDGQLWFKSQIKRASPEIRRVIEREFSHKNFDYIRKLGVIRENIYGVDIQPVATEISRLRCFLTLVVDERIDESLPNRGIEPLPNLDFKFVTANSLISLPSNPQTTLFKDQYGIDQLKDLRNQFFNATNSERYQLKDEFKEIQKRMLLRMLESKGSDDITQKLSAWDPFNNKASSWFDAEWMFGIEKGFDIVIANPPYVQMQKDKGKLANELVSQNYQTFERTGDIYSIFYEHGLKILKEAGIETFITSSQWMKANYGRSLRKLFLTKNPLKLIALGPSVFESATVDTNILIVQNSKYKMELEGSIIDQAKQLNNLNNIEFHPMPYVTEEPWTIMSLAKQSIDEKIKANGKPLNKWKVRINFGIKTGYNPAFIIDEAKREELINSDALSAEIVKPLLRGREIEKYFTEWDGGYLISTFPALSIQISKYKAVKNYLEGFLPKLNQTGETFINIEGEAEKTRKKTSNKWFETQDQIGYYKELAKEKIIWKRIGSLIRFSYSDKQIYCLDSTCIATGEKIKYLTALLNSKLFNYQLLENAPRTGMGDLILSVQALEPLFVHYPDETEEKLIVSIFDEILFNKGKSKDTTDLERRLDDIIFKIYGLTENEIRIVENSIEKYMGLLEEVTSN